MDIRPSVTGVAIPSFAEVGEPKMISGFAAAPPSVRFFALYFFAFTLLPDAAAFFVCRINGVHPRLFSDTRARVFFAGASDDGGRGARESSALASSHTSLFPLLRSTLGVRFLDNLRDSFRILFGAELATNY